MKEKAAAALGLLAAALLAGNCLSGPARARERRADDEVAQAEPAKPDKRAAKHTPDKAGRTAPRKDAGGPDKKPPKKDTGKPASKPAKAPPRKKDDLGIPPEDLWLGSQAARTELQGQVFGPPLDLADRKGQVLLVAHWDSNREKTKRLLPGLVRLDGQYRRRGLIVIGVRKYHRDRGQVISTCQQYGVDFAVYAGALVPDTNFGKFVKLKTPYCYVLDHTGKVIFEDRPGGGMIAAVQAALRKRPHPLLGDAEYPKSAAILSKIRAGKLGEAMALCKKAQDKGGQAADEAALLLASLERNAKRLLAKAHRTLKRHPQSAIDTLARVKRQYANSAFGEQAEARLKELSQDESLQNELTAERECRPLIRALGAIPRFPYNAKSSHQNRWVRTYGPTLRAAKARIGRLSKKYADTRALKQAEALFHEAMPERPEK